MGSDLPVRRHLVVVLIYLVGYYLISYPATHTFTTHILSDNGDGPQNLWNNWWVRHAVANGKSPWWTDYLYHPEGTSLVTATLNPFNGFMTVPLCWFVGQVTAFNILVVFSFVATGYTMFLLCRGLEIPVWPSALAGGLFTFCPFHTAHAYGHMQLVSMEWLPLFVLFWVLFLRRPSHRLALVAAGALFLNLLCDYYLTMFCVATGALMAGFLAVARRQPFFLFHGERWRAVATFVVAASVLCGPLLVSLIGQIKDAELVGIHDPMAWRNEVLSFLIPTRIWRFSDLTEWFWSLHPQQWGWIEMTAHLGIGVIAAGITGLLVHRRTHRRLEVWMWVFLGVVFYLLSLGPVFLWFGQDIDGVITPFWILERVLPPIKAAGVPSRMAVVTYLAAAIMAAHGVAWAAERWPRSFGRWLWVPLVALMAVEYWPQPLPTYRPDITPVIKRLAELPPGVVVGLRDESRDTLWYQTVFEKPIPTGYVARVPLAKMVAADEIRWKLRQGEFRAAFSAAGATYLLREPRYLPPVRNAHFKMVQQDHRFQLFVDVGNPLDGIPANELFARHASVRLIPGRGDERVIEVRAPGHAGKTFCCVMSVGLRPHEPMDFFGAPLWLQDDWLLRQTLARHSPLIDGNWMRLDSTGTGRVVLRGGATLDGEITLWASLIVLEDEPRLKVVKITDPTRIYFRN